MEERLEPRQGSLMVGKYVQFYTLHKFVLGILNQCVQLCDVWRWEWEKVIGDCFLEDPFLCEGSNRSNVTLRCSNVILRIRIHIQSKNVPTFLLAKYKKTIKKIV